MKTYKCHKVVQAAKILGVDVTASGYVLWLDDNNLHVAVHETRWNKTKVGDYYVVYRDGYASFSPAKEFEDGYTEMPNTGLGDTHEPTERSLQIAAQAWQGPNTSHIEMDSRLAYEFAKILDRERQTA